MSISAIGAGITGISTPLNPIGTSSSAQSLQQANAAPEQAGGAHLTRRGQFLHKLQELAKTDPEQARKLVADLAEKIRTEAKQGGANSDRRLALADRLQQAADTGDFSLLEHDHPKSSSGSPAAQAYANAAAITRSSQ